MFDYMRVCMIQSCAIPECSMIVHCFNSRSWPRFSQSPSLLCLVLVGKVTTGSVYRACVCVCHLLDWGEITVYFDRFRICQFRWLSITGLFSGRSVEQTFLRTAESNLFIMESLLKWFFSLYQFITASQLFMGYHQSKLSSYPQGGAS